MTTRRELLKLSVLAVAASAVPLAGCGSGGGSGSGADGALRFTWWGNPARNERTVKVIDAFKAANSGINVNPEPGEWSSYWDKLATQFAGNDAPDLIQMDEKYLSEYGGRGALADLTKLGLDTSKFAEGTVQSGELPEKGLVAINAGINAVIVGLNTDVFDKAGVKVPDDESWTWDDLNKVAADVTKGSPSGTYGISSLASSEPTLRIWLRQRGKDEFGPDGLGFDEADLQSFLEYTKKLQDDKACPPASVAVEDAGKSVDQSMFATGKLGMAVFWSNQVVAYDQATNGKVKLLRLPSTTGKASDVKLWYKASMYWSVNARSKNQENAVKLINFMVNDPAGAKILGAERGIPANTECRQAIEGDLSASEKKIVEFLDKIQGELGDVPTVTPMGGGEFANILLRQTQDVLFDRSSPADAAKKVIEETKGNLK